MAAGAVAFVYAIYCLIRLILIRKWPATEGKIVTSHKTRRTFGLRRFEDAEVAYEYAVNGRRYCARVIQAGGDVSDNPSKSGNNIDKILAKYPIDSTVTVFYNPRFPQMACLEHSDATAVFIGLLFGPLAIAGGYYFLS